MKKLLAILLALTLCVGVLAACGETGAGASGDVVPASQEATGSEEQKETTAPSGDGVELRVVSSFSGTDGNRPTFEKTYKDWEAETGNTVIDESQTSDESWKAKVVADFETGSDPDVLFFFNGADSNSFIEAGKVVSLEDIIAEYPEYGANMNMDSVPASPVDGERYALPSTGFWEGLFVNKAVLDEVGVDVPDENTTWEEFIEMCQKIKDAGKIPISASLQEVPHYWFEFTIMNNGGPANHLDIPKEEGDAAYQSWVAGENDIKELYEKGFFPEDTLTATDEETCQYIYDDKAAFLIDGSWKVGQFVSNVGPERLEDFDVTYVPAKGERKPTDIIGGLSMGWFITQKAWEDEAKREAAVDFVMTMTDDEVINTMAAGTAITALKEKSTEKPEISGEFTVLHERAFEMINGTASATPAVQDYIKPEAKEQVLTTDTKLVASGDITAEEAVDNMMAVN